MSPAKLHSLKAPIAPASPSSVVTSPDTPNSRGLSSHSPYQSNGLYADDTRPTTALSYNPRDTDHLAMEDAGVQRSVSRASTSGGEAIARNNTLKKKSAVTRKASLKRSGSRRSLSAGNIKGVAFAEGQGPAHSDYNSALTTPIPTQASPTDILANRFQAWRVFLKSLITYFREVQTSYETRAKAIMKVSNVVSNTQIPTIFMSEASVVDANRILTEYHKQAAGESSKAREIEYEVIQALNGLRADLGSKIKEIKGLNGDFKNSVEKELEATRRAVQGYQESLQHFEREDGFDKGSSDPFLVRLNVDRLVEKQIDEENYLHRAYLNLESSGRELESIVVGEVQKAYNALAGIMKREADEAYHTVDLLRSGPISFPKDADWSQFVIRDPHLVNPELPLRRLQDIHYPGIDNPAAAEIRSGMLERKSKYLKSYTPGWYVLSPTHIHEFKSADNIYSQPPVMSLYLGDQKLGSHSGPESSSHKFMLKGRQTGSSMHRGHSWVFRAESYDTMLEWYEAIQSLTEKTGAERTEYVRKHARSISGNSQRAMSVASSDGLEEDEADGVPYSASTEQLQQGPAETRPERPAPGGRFPSDLAIPRLVAPSDESSEPDAEAFGADVVPMAVYDEQRPHSQPRPSNPYVLQGIASHVGAPIQAVPREEPIPAAAHALPVHPSAPMNQFNPTQQSYPDPSAWTDVAAAGAGAGLGAGAVAAMHHHDDQQYLGAAAVPDSRFSTSTAPSALSADTDLTETSVPAKPAQPTRQKTDVSVSELHVPGEFPKPQQKPREGPVLE